MKGDLSGKVLHRKRFIENVGRDENENVLLLTHAQP